MCYSSVCYCEAGFTGDYCEVKYEDLSKGIALGTALIVLICLTLLGCIIGVSFYYKLIKGIIAKQEIEAHERSKAKQ